MLLVRDIDLREECLLLARALKADTVGERVVDPAVLRIRPDFLAIDQYAEALLVESSGRVDGFERDRDGISDAIPERGERGREIGLDVQDCPAGEFGRAPV